MENHEMYREHILEHYKHPHNFGKMNNATVVQHEHNPLCGDDLTVYIKTHQGKVVDVSFEGKGCAISIASASLVTDHVKGMTIEHVMKLTKEDILELLMIPIGPVRLKCALLSIQSVHHALGSKNKETLQSNSTNKNKDQTKGEIHGTS